MKKIKVLPHLNKQLTLSSVDALGFRLFLEKRIFFTIPLTICQIGGILEVAKGS